MKKKGMIMTLAGVVILFAAGAFLTVTKQDEYKLVRPFGKVQRVVGRPGVSL